MVRRVSRYIFNSLGGALPRVLVALVGVGTLIVWLLSRGAVASESDMCAVTKKALEEASRIRGLAATATVPCVVRSRQEIEAFLRATIAEKFPKDTLEMEELMYRAIGLVPDDYDYAQGVVSAYVQQIGGYYDPDKKLFVMLDTMSDNLQLPLAVHELTHALQDQKFDLSKFLEPTTMDSDELMARAALVEGDATAVMQDFMSTQKMKERGSQGRSPGEVAVPVPAALERVLLFPYIQGLNFTRRIIREGGFSAINEAFARPPSTSREILHPEQYMTRAFWPKRLDVRDLEKPKGASSPVYDDTIGEFSIAALLGEALSSQTRGDECAQGWKRDRVAVFKGAEDKKLISWMTEWDSEGEAREFSDCYRETLKVRYQKDVQEELLAVSPSKKMRVRQKGASVLVEIELAQLGS